MIKRRLCAKKSTAVLLAVLAHGTSLLFTWPRRCAQTPWEQQHGKEKGTNNHCAGRRRAILSCSLTHGAWSIDFFISSTFGFLFHCTRHVFSLICHVIVSYDLILTREKEVFTFVEGQSRRAFHGSLLRCSHAP